MVPDGTELTPLSISSSESERNPVTSTLLSDADRRAVAEMAVTLDASKHGCVYFGVCNNRLKIEAVEAAIKQALWPHGMDVERVVLAERDTTVDPPSYRVHIVNLFDYFDTLPRQRSRLYFIHGLPDLIREQTGGDSSKVAPVSQLLNYRREYFHDQRLCVLFWLYPETVPYLTQNSPDFWSFRSGMPLFIDNPPVAQLPASSGWQQSEPSDRWSGDLEEMLRQLAAYKQRNPPDENAIANLQLEIGRIHVHRHEPDKAFDVLRKAANTFVRLGLRNQVRLVNTWLSRAFKQKGQFEEAEECIRQAIEIDSVQKNEASLATDYKNLSQVYTERSQFDEAEKWLHRAIAINEKLGDEPKLSVLYNNLSEIYFARGQSEGAENWLRNYMDINERLGSERNRAIDFSNLSLIFQTWGQLEEAERWLRKSVEIDNRLGDEQNLAIDYSNLSQIYKLRGELDRAETELRRAMAICERLGDELHLAICYNDLGQIYQSRGELETAEMWLRKSVDLADRLRDEPNLAIGYSNLSKIYRDRGKFTEACEWLKKAIEVDTWRGDEMKVAIRCSDLSQMYDEQGLYEEAETWLRKALALVEPKGPSATLETLKSNLEQLEREKKQQPPTP